MGKSEACKSSWSLQLRIVGLNRVPEILFTDKLAWFKQNERPETVLLIADSPDLIKVVLAWTSLNITHSQKTTEPNGNSENEVWEWLWKNTDYSPAELLEKLGPTFSRLGLERKMKLLIGNRIIYPDGTVNSFVQKYLREQVVKLFEAKTKRSPKR